MSRTFATAGRPMAALAALLVFSAAAPCVSSAAPPAAASPAPEPQAGDSFYGKYVRGRLSAGVKCSWPSLGADDRPEVSGDGFIGHVNHLGDTGMSATLSLEYQVCDYLRLELSGYEIGAKTLNWNNHLTDGDVKLEGPYVGVKLQLPLFGGTVVPYVGGGCAFLSGDFDEAYWWYNGWASEQSWRSMGAPRSQRTPYHREIHVEDATGFVYGLGVTVRLRDRLELEGFVNFCDVDPSCEYGYSSGGKFRKHQDGDFDLENCQVGFCARCVF